MLESKLGRYMYRLGMVEQARKNIVQVLRKRFGTEALLDIETALADIDSLETLKALLDPVIDCRSLAEFRKELPATARQR